MHYLRTVSSQQRTTIRPAARAAFALLVSQAILGASAASAGNPLSGDVNLPYAPLASQDQSSFGEAIAFVPAAYTPQGIVSHVRLVLASQNEMGFGYEIVFVPSSYTPPGVGFVDLIEVAAVSPNGKKQK